MALILLVLVSKKRPASELVIELSTKVQAKQVLLSFSTPVPCAKFTRGRA